MYMETYIEKPNMSVDTSEEQFGIRESMTSGNQQVAYLGVLLGTRHQPICRVYTLSCEGVYAFHIEDTLESREVPMA